MDFDARLDLIAAMRERDTLRLRLEEAQGTPAEMDVFCELRAAETRVTARDRFLAWTEEAPVGATPRPTAEEMEVLL